MLLLSDLNKAIALAIDNDVYYDKQEERFIVLTSNDYNRYYDVDRAAENDDELLRVLNKPVNENLKNIYNIEFDYEDRYVKLECKTEEEGINWCKKNKIKVK